MGDFGGPSYSKGTVGIRPSSVNIPANGTAYADIDCNQGGGSAAKTQVTVVWEAKGCSAAKGGVILGANKYNIQFGESPSGSVTEEVAPGEYLVLANIGVRENSGNQVGEWKVPQDHSVSPISLTVTEGKTSTVTIKTSCDGSSVDQKGEATVTVKWNGADCDGFKGTLETKGFSCRFGDGASGSTSCTVDAPVDLSFPSSLSGEGAYQVLQNGSWVYPPNLMSVSPTSLSLKPGGTGTVTVTTKCDASVDEEDHSCGISFTSTGNTGGAAQGVCHATGGNGYDGSVTLSKGTSYKGELKNLVCGYSYTISCSGSGTGSTYKLTPSPSSISRLTGTQNVTVNFELAQESASTSSCNFLYRVFSTGTSYNGFAGQVIYSLSCSGKGRFSSGNTIKVHLPCKSDVVSIDLSGKTGDEIGNKSETSTALYPNCLPQSCQSSVNSCATVYVNGKESTWVTLQQN